MNVPTPKYISVENHIKQAIRTRQFVDKLPGERTLARQLNVSYMTIRKAIDNLTQEGVLYKESTKGTFINTGMKNTRKTQKTRTIGYFLDQSIEAGISSPYYSMIFNAIQKEAARHDYSLVYFSDANLNKSDKTLAKLDGVIATCFPRIEDTIFEIRQSLPVVVIDNDTADKTIPSIIIDNFNALVDCVSHFHSLGHDRIGFMTGLEDSDIGKSRHRGYEQGLKRSQLPFDETLVYKGDYSYESGIEGATYFLSLKQLPSAIICANDSMALGAIKQLKQAGLNIPDDIGIVGFDDIEVASQIEPALTTIAAPVQAIAEHAVSTLDKLINGIPLQQSHVILPAKLITRQSCARPQNTKTSTTAQLQV